MGFARFHPLSNLLPSQRGRTRFYVLALLGSSRPLSSTTTGRRENGENECRVKSGKKSVLPFFSGKILRGWERDLYRNSWSNLVRERIVSHSASVFDHPRPHVEVLPSIYRVGFLFRLKQWNLFSKGNFKNPTFFSPAGLSAFAACLAASFSAFPFSFCAILASLFCSLQEKSLEL